MAYKTMLRQLISKWGIMSIEMQTAIDSDMAIINEDGTKDYVEIEEPEIVESVSHETEEKKETPKEETQPENTDEISAALFG